MKQKRFTFKTEKSTGRYRSFCPSTHYIKFKKKEVGYIEDKSFKIYLKIIKDDINEDGNPNCEWKWISLKKKSESLQEAKDFLNEYIDIIFDKYNLCMED